MIQPTLEELYEKGWSLIPAGADKRALVLWKQYQTDRASLKQVEEWQRQFEPAIWGGITGPVSRTFTLDFDGPEGLATLRALGFEPHRQTPRDGFHVDFSYPIGWDVRTVSNKSDKTLRDVFPGMDIRGVGGYANLLGGSTEGAYVWVRREHPYALDDIPGELLPHLERRATKATSHPREASPRSLRPSPEGSTDGAAGRFLLMAYASLAEGQGRNDTGFRLAQQLRDHGIDHDSAWATMERYHALCPTTNTQGVVEPYTETDARRSLDQAYGREARERFLPVSGDRPCIVVNNRQHREVVADARRALEASNDPPHLFCHQGQLVRLRNVEGRQVKDTMNPDSLRVTLAEASDWVRATDKGPRAVSPPPDVVKSLLSSEWTEFPVLRGVVEAPFPRMDGSLVTDVGYDPISEFWLDLPQGLKLPRIPECPSDDDIAWARQLLCEELLGEFCFVDQASRANACALVLTALLRSAIDGCIPLGVIDARSARTGKTFLAKVVSLVATGYEPAVKPPPSRDDEELRKVVTSTLSGGEPIVVFDNVEGVTKSSVLASMLTLQVWSDRLLGVSKNVRVEQHAVWMLTGNNVTLGGDLKWRCYRIDMDARTHRPGEREFKRPDLDKWILARRGDLLSACFVLWRAWCVRGRPLPKMKRLGGFTEWQDTLGGVLHVAGIGGFLGNLADFQDQADPDDLAWEGLLRCGLDKFGSEPASAQVIFPLTLVCELPAGLSEAIHATSTRNQVVRFGRALKRIEGRRFAPDGLRIESTLTSHAKKRMWMFVVDDVPESNGGKA